MADMDGENRLTLYSLPYEPQGFALDTATNKYVMCTMYTVHCILYSVQCTLYTVQYTMYSVQCTVYIVHCT